MLGRAAQERQACKMARMARAYISCCPALLCIRHRILRQSHVFARSSQERNVLFSVSRHREAVKARDRKEHVSFTFSRAPVKKETCSFRSLAFTASRWRASRSLSIRRNRRRTLLPCLHSAIHRWRRARGSVLLAHCRRLRIGHADRAVLSPTRRTFAKLVPKVGSSWTSLAQSALL